MFFCAPRAYHTNIAGGVPPGQLLLPLHGPFRAGRPAGARSGFMAKLFAVYQFGWRDRMETTTPVGDGVTTPTWALIGICRDAAKAERIAERLRKAGRTAVDLGVRPHEPLIGRAEYDPFQFVASPDRKRVTRSEAHRRAVAGVVARRAELGIS
jgi:hypothetical protein